MWMVYDEMMGIFHAVKATDSHLADRDIIEMVTEEQEEKGWPGRIS